MKDSNRTFVVRRLAALAITGLLLASGSTTASGAESAADKPKDSGGVSIGAIIADLLLARPAGLIYLGPAAAAFILMLPVEAASGDIKGSFKRLIVEPGRYTFVRRLGKEL